MENSVKRVYYAISEELAKQAKQAYSHYDYVPGSATATYRSYVDEVYDKVEEIAEKKPECTEKAKYMADRYSRRLADWYNAHNRNTASCVSWFISGAGNYPVQKHKKQQEREDRLMQEWKQIEEYKEKIEDLLHRQQPILSNDENAIERLEEKLEGLKETQETMKAVNAYYRKNGTLDGAPGLTEASKAAIEKAWANGWYAGIPFPPYELSNNNANIHTTENRLKKLKAAKEAGNSETDYGAFTVIENADIMRIQISFEQKPDEETRGILKRNGFIWSQKNSAWQRQLTDNGKSATRRVIPELKAIYAE